MPLTSTLQCNIDGDVENEFISNWTTQIRKGVFELSILSAIRGRQLYGYDIVKRLRDIDGLVISEGTIYPILSRFKREGLVKTSLVESNEGPARKYYQLTPYGEKLLAQMQTYWEKIEIGIETLSKEPRP
jgi:PadR family transcriptional regulator, regulatory protein PadR